MAYIWWLRPRVPWAWVVILALVIWSHLFRQETLKRLGFTSANLEEGLRIVVPFVLFAGAVMISAGLMLGTMRNVMSDSVVSSFGYYCVWGLLQQYLLNGYFTNRVSAFVPDPTPHRTALWSACLFAGAHLPNWFLMLITFAGGYLSARFYLRFRNLYVLGLAHAALGVLLYLVVPDSVSHHMYVGPKWFLH